MAILSHLLLPLERAEAVPKVAKAGAQDLGAVEAGSGASGTGIARTGMSESSAVF